MAITKQFVDLMGGNIRVESEVAKGSKFTVELAFDIDFEKKTETQVQEETENVNIAGMRILLVEDNELNMEIAQELLEAEGAKVSVSMNGQEALDKFLEMPAGSFDVILMDIMMPVMNGYEATRAIRNSAHAEAKTIPIVAMTANAYKEDVEQAMEAGMNGHIAKPIDVNLLLSVMEKYKK
jgi:CheY-like chemotaxis protein